MKSIALMAMKGGVGKTTLAVHLAVAAMRAGESVAIIDTDPQASAVAWARVRDGGSPDVVPIPVQRLAQALAAAADDYSVVIVDTAPRASVEAAIVCGTVDLTLIPTRPSAVDLETLEQSVSIVQAAKCEGLIVLNACPARAPENAEARGYAVSLGLAVAMIAIGERRPFARAFAEGAGIAERERGSASDEVAALWGEVAARLDIAPRTKRLASVTA
jgi:chromosome partitioning protein